jgi:Protein of unknown function (DUF3224)
MHTPVPIKHMYTRNKYYQQNCMNRKASGILEIEKSPKPFDIANEFIGNIKYHGGLEGVSECRVIHHGTTYLYPELPYWIQMETFSGTLHGCKCSFVLQEVWTIKSSKPDVSVIQEFGTEDFTILFDSMTTRYIEGGRFDYEFHYTLLEN